MRVRSSQSFDRISFAPACPEDAEALVALRIEAMRESLERVGRFDPLRARERFIGGFSPEHTRHVLLGSQRVGFFVLKPREKGLLLDHLYVHPLHQGNGIGAAVLAHVFMRADALGAQVHVGALRESRANRFYARHGFTLVEEGEFDNYYLRSVQNAL